MVSIQSSGDLEVVVLNEAHSALASIIGPDLYKIGGEAPEQTAIFHDDPAFDLFLIFAGEFFSEGVRSANISGKYQNYSLFSALMSLAEKHQGEMQARYLHSVLEKTDAWMTREVEFEFWCPEVQTQIKLLLSRKQVLHFGNVAVKHNLLRLSDLLTKLAKWCQDADYQFSSQQLIPVFNSMNEEVRNRLRYHATYMLELLGEVFMAVNRIIVSRFDANPTNRADQTHFPSDLTDDVFRDLYSSMLVFRRYDEDKRIRAYTPACSQYLKLKY